MTWDDKVSLAKALNQGRYKEAVNFLSDRKEEVDYSDFEIFIIGFNLSHSKELTPIRDLIEKFSEESKSLLVQMRAKLAIIKMDS